LPSIKRGFSIAILFVLLLACALGAAYLLFISGYLMRHPSFDNFPIQGIDVSHHQGDINWELVATDPRGAFAYMKATEGGDFKDKSFPDNWAQAKRQGIARGAYHFFTLCRPGVDQAKNFVDSLKSDFGELPPALDLEYLGTCKTIQTPDDVLREVTAFVDELKRHDPRKPVFYVGGGFYQKYMKVLADKYPEHDDWARNLILEPSSADWLFWQFAETGRVEGIDGPVDLNVFNGSRQEFQKRFAIPLTE
jgi:lysozyme